MVKFNFIEFKQIVDTIKEKGELSLGKQCKEEYIVYKFYLSNKSNSIVERKTKEQYTDNTLIQLKKSPKITLIDKPLSKVIDDDIYDLVLRGYELIK